MVAGATPIARHSGLQKQVLSLYRRALRTARTKPDAATSLETVRSAFREHQGVDRKDFRLIEFLLRKGERKVKLLSSPGVQTARTMQASRTQS